uniref:Uncharacterized protein n=1 Tax=Glossina pallidipes TaxID=7398 RepID=A0A1B0A018_GLOPL
MKKQITHLALEEATLKKSEIVSRLCGHGGCRLWPLAILFMSLMLQLFGSSMAFTLPLPFGYSSLSIKNLLNSVLLSSNANLAGGGRNLKSDVLEDASLITKTITATCSVKDRQSNESRFSILCIMKAIR